MKHWSDVQQMLEENEQLRQRVAAQESEIAALTETIEQWKKGDEWSNRVTYDNVVDQIASLEDASKRDDARRMFEPLLKKSQVTQFRKDIKRRVKELNEDSDAYSDEQVARHWRAAWAKGWPSMPSGSGPASIGICAGRATILWMLRSSARRFKAWSWIFLTTMSAATKASGSSARSRLWTMHTGTDPTVHF